MASTTKSTKSRQIVTQMTLGREKGGMGGGVGGVEGVGAASTAGSNTCHCSG